MLNPAHPATPFIPSHRSALATGPGGESPGPPRGSIAFVVAPCTIEMTGAFDMASLVKMSEMGTSVETFKRFLGENQISFSIAPLEPRADSTSSGKLEGCESTGLKANPPETTSGITWLLKGDATRMNGRFLFPDPEDGTTTVLKVALTTK